MAWTLVVVTDSSRLVEVGIWEDSESLEDSRFVHSGVVGFSSVASIVVIAPALIALLAVVSSSFLRDDAVKPFPFFFHH